METHLAMHDGTVDEHARTGTHVRALKHAVLDNLLYVAGTLPENATKLDFYTAVAYTVRDRIIAPWLSTFENSMLRGHRAVAYLSAEFLLGPQLAANLLNLGAEAPMREALRELGLN